jgi:hypothetical protein
VLTGTPAILAQLFFNNGPVKVASLRVSAYLKALPGRRLFIVSF